MKSITSRDNALYKELKLLASNSQARRKSGQTLLDGIHLCEAYLNSVGMPVMCIVGEGARENPEVAAILARCEEGDTSCVSFPGRLFESLSQVENGIALVFLIRTPTAVPPCKLTQASVLLDNLQDPGNLGSILRSAAAAGIKQVFCSRGSVFAWSPKVLRAGMGAHFLLEIVENVDLETLIGTASLPVLATSSHAPQCVYEADLRQPVAWLFGHEGQGVNPQLLALATHQVSIPHKGNVESLNVAACAAVCFFEQLRQQTVPI